MNKQEKILIIDDDVAITTVIKTILAHAGYATNVFNHSEKIVELLANVTQTQVWDYDLIILDLMMPIINGRELLKLVRQNPLTQMTPVIILSGISDINQRAELLALGANEYLLKPCPADDLVTHVGIQIKLYNLTIARLKAESRVEQQLEYLNAINIVAYIASSNLYLEKILEKVSEQIHLSFRVNYCFLFYVHPETDDLLTIKSASDSPFFPIAYQTSKQVQASKQALIEAPCFGFPILRGRVIVGVLYLNHSINPEIWTDFQEAILMVCHYMAVAITNAHLFEDIQYQNFALNHLLEENNLLLTEEKQKRQQAEQLHKLARIVTASLNPQEVMNLISEHIQSLINAEKGLILLVDKQTQKIFFARPLFEHNRVMDFSLNLDQSIASRVIVGGMPILTNDPQNHPDFNDEKNKKLGITVKNILCVPLIVREKIIGALELINKQSGNFNQYDLTVLISLASTIAIAIDNAYLYEEQALLYKQLLQQEKFAVAGRLAASMAHEINNPIQAVHSCLQLVTQFPLPPEKHKEYLEMANAEVERLAEISNRFLRFFRPSSGKHEHIKVYQLLKQVIQLAQKYVAHNKLNIQEVFSPDDQFIYVVCEQMEQVFLSIILNAVEAMTSEGVLFITTLQEQNCVKIIFQDTGVGMNQEISHKVFEPFFTTKADHAGLGLTISYDIVAKHQGLIEIHSIENKGTTVVVALPNSHNPN